VSQFGHAHLTVAAGLLFLAGCGDGKAPTSPSGPLSFLSGTWRGTVTIEATGQPPASAPMTWTFVVVPQSNQQSFNATIQSQHPWLPITMQGVADIAPSANPPTQIGTEGNYSSPRGCRGVFGSFGIAEATRIEASFDGADCNDTTFRGTVTLTKDGAR
jgi:hypothetical protein